MVATSPQTCCCAPRRRNYRPSNFFAEGLEGGPKPSHDDVEAAASSDVESALSDSSLLLESDERREITVRFPEEQLSVVTGHSASKKTALLVRRRVPPLSTLSYSLVQYAYGAAWRDDTTTRRDRVQEHIKDRGEWILACHFVRCSISVVEASVYQGQ